MSYVNPSVSDFKGYFSRDFPYGTDPANAITDTDITYAMQSASFKINPGLYGNQNTYTIAFFNLSAHYLVLRIRASGQGLNGQFNFMQSSKGIGGVSESFSLPPDIADDALYQWYTKTNYGAQYLMDVLPSLRACAFGVIGRTQP